MYMTLLQVRSMLISPRSPSLAILLFNRPTGGILPRFNRQPLLCDHDECNLIVLIGQQSKSNEDIDTFKNIPFLPTGSTVVVQWEDGRP